MWLTVCNKLYAVNSFLFILPYRHPSNTADRFKFNIGPWWEWWCRRLGLISCWYRAERLCYWGKKYDISKCKYIRENFNKSPLVEPNHAVIMEQPRKFDYFSLLFFFTAAAPLVVTQSWNCSTGTNFCILNPSERRSWHEASVHCFQRYGGLAHSDHFQVCRIVAQ